MASLGVMAVKRSSIATACCAMRAAAAVLRSTMERAVCFFAGSSGMGVVLAQMSLAPVDWRRVTILARRAV